MNHNHKYWMASILLCVGMMLQLAQAYAFELSFTEKEIQEKVSAMMPYKKQKFFITMIVTNPVVDLLSEENRVGLTADIEVQAPGDIDTSGKVRLSGTLRYDNEQGAFYLQEIVLHELDIGSLKGKQKDQIKNMVEASLRTILARRPVYKLKDDKLKQKLAKALLKSIRIKDEVLYAELSLF